MLKSEIKEIFFMIIFCILNTFIAFAITDFLEIADTIVIKTFSVIYGDITWEVIIFMGLMLIASLIYDGIYDNESCLSKLHIN